MYPVPAVTTVEEVTGPVASALTVAVVVGVATGGTICPATLTFAVTPGVTVAGISFATKTFPLPAVVKIILYQRLLF